MELKTFNLICFIWMGLAIAVHFLMFKVTAPFGRHTSEKWGPMINNKAGWVIMEIPSFGIMLAFLLIGAKSFSGYTWLIFAAWLLHYFNRTFIFPTRTKPTPKKMPVFIVGNAIFFNLINAGLNGYYLAELAPMGKYGPEWLTDPRFIIGLVLFFLGMYINMRSDNILINLRKPGETGYKIPKGFLFKYVSAPNLFGEIIEWVGFALMAWNLPALTFAVWTFANLVPRAKNHHDFYLEKFEEYPKERKVVIPYLY